MNKLTTRQQKIYDFITDFSRKYGYPPSVREIGDYMGVKSPSTVHFHLKGMKEAGVISQPEGKTRAITINTEHPIAKQSNRDIPVLGHVAAGSPILAQEHIEEYITYPMNTEDDSLFALRVRGDSMINAGILPNDLVIVKPQQSAHNRDIVVALFEDEATVKTYQKTNDAVWLLPENPNYAPIDGTLAQIIGKVVYVLRRY